MSDFTDFCALMPFPDGRWILKDDMPFDLVHGDPSTRIVVPKGFVTDGASIPVGLRMIFDRGDSRYMKAAVIHDWMLESRRYTPRRSADAFADALRSAGVSPLRVKTMWAGVLAYTSVKYRLVRSR